MVRGGSALSYARRIRAVTRHVHPASRSGRQEGQAQRAGTSGAGTPAVQLEDRVPSARVPYARVVGTRTGAPVRIVVLRDGSVRGEQQPRCDDPLKATIAVVRECDHVTSLWFRRVGWRPDVPLVEAAAQLDDVRGEPAEQARQEMAERLDERVIRLVVGAGLAATSLLNRVADSYTQDRLTYIVSTLDEVLAEVRSIIFERVAEQPTDDPPPAS